MEKQTGIMREVRVGCDDRVGKCRLMFTVYTAPGSGFATHVNFPEAAILIEQAGVEDVKQMEGRPCYWHEDGAYNRFDGLWDTPARLP